MNRFLSLLFIFYNCLSIETSFSSQNTLESDFSDTKSHGENNEDEKDITSADIKRQKEDGIPYSHHFVPDDNKEALKALEEKSFLVKLAESPPLSLTGLTKRAQKDREIFKKVLASLGYFKNEVKFTVEETKPAKVTTYLTLGPRFKVQNITFACPKNPKALEGISNQLPYDLIGLKQGDFVNISKLEDGVKKVKTYFQQRGYAFVSVEFPKGNFDESENTVQITYKIEAYTLARIKETKIKGLKKLDPTYVLNRVLWKNEQLYDQTLVNKTKHKLLETGLVGNITIEPEKINTDSLPENEKPANSEEPVKMVINVKEAAPRVIGAGVHYASYDGIGANLFWRHNNIGGHGDQLGFNLQRSNHEHKAVANYNVADFLSPEQSLMNEVSYAWELTRAYVGKMYNVGTRVERPLTENLKGFIGTRYEIGRLKRETVAYNTDLVAVPVGAKLDKSNSVLDPTTGYRLNGDVTPYYGKLQGNSGMTVTQAGGSAYLPLMKNEVGESPVVLASFLKGGSIWIKQTDMIPPNKRFYLGGPGSVRGYGFQLLGPLDQYRVPIGGRSFSEFGTEFRFKTSESIGFVTFLEAGTVQDQKTPKPTKDLLWGTGLGFRYYSSIAPIRFDIGFPLKRRRDANGKTIDSAFQLYVSIGQAF